MDPCVCTGPPVGASARPGPSRGGSSRRRRSARALSLATTGALTAGCAHALATGTALTPAALAAGGAVALAVVHPLAGRRPSVALGTTALTLLQAVLHLLFGALTPSAPAAHALADTAHGHGAALHPGALPLPTPPMLCGHLLAAAALAWLLHRGELATEQLSAPGRSPVLAALRRAVLTLRRRPCLGQCSLPRVPERAFPLPRRRQRAFGTRILTAHEVTRRGPPGGLPAPG
ncbi:MULTISPECIES: hypothetical protein [unclassified Streptomyces]|uniref:hypothetical protein n=1 Tax=unclassified Streptomyces TaxID=2593676 RepID=UPI000823A9AA|nr:MULTISPECIES: hypothetical protein [unclassified Streptomyces]MYT99578.1 hypothetical protein [Streptomyces sp. SID8350]NGO82750.1 hypothetical protein [Streptomyces sp. 196(2019)]SCK21171.1 hypothetical protein YUWDRAFT_01482 [Streptomyces sp. AmelKG-D3]